MTEEGITQEVRAVVGEFGRLSVDVASIADDADLYRLGLTSHGSVNVMLAVEDAFNIELPEHMLRKSTFGSIQAIRDAVAQVLGEVSAKAG